MEEDQNHNYKAYQTLTTAILPQLPKWASPCNFAESEPSFYDFKLVIANLHHMVHMVFDGIAGLLNFYAAYVQVSKYK